MSNSDYSLIPVIEVARLLFGQEHRDRSTKTENTSPITAPCSSTSPRTDGTRT